VKKIITLIVLINTFNVFASDVNIPNIFVANQPAVASEVNGNFTAVKSAVDDNNTRLEALESLVTQLQNDLTSANNTINSLNSRLLAVENNTVLELDGLLMYSELHGYPTAEFRAVNLQVNNGSGYTDFSRNGLGNIIIGYHEIISDAPLFCSDGQYIDSVNCIGNGHIWDRNVHRGMHNLILGKGNSYDDYASIISGFTNVTNASYTAAIAGQNNIASGHGSAVISGKENVANNFWSIVVGGDQNTASGYYSTVTGGRRNEASAVSASVSGGYSREAVGASDWVAGSLFEDL